MKSLYACIAIIPLFLCSSFEMEDITRTMTTVMTYNIHIEHCTEQPRSWDDRKSMVAQLIRSRDPEVLGIQGSTLGQIHWLQEELSDYAYYAPVKGNLKMGTDLCPIMYSNSVYEKLDEGTFLIGEAVQDDEEGEKQSQFLNWVKLKHIEGDKIIYVLNTRIEGDDDSNKDPITERMQEVVSSLVGEETFVLLGDLQSTPESNIYSSISSWANDSYSTSLVSISEQEATQFGWDRTGTGERVDYVFLSPDIPANSYEVLDVAMEDMYPSDHLPVFCRLRLQ